MYALRWIVTLLIFIPFAVESGGPVEGVTLTHVETLSRLSIRSASGEGLQKIRSFAPLALSFDALGRSFDIELEPNSGLLEAARRSGLAGEAIPYRGRLVGIEDSWVRLVLTDAAPAGLIWDGEDLIAIERPGDSLLDHPEPIVYRLADMLVAPGTLSCAGGSVTATGAQIFAGLTQNLKTGFAKSVAADSRIEIGAIGDFEFTDQHGTGAGAAILTRLNNVDGIFSAQVGVQIDVPIVETFDTNTDPFSDTTVPATLLDELADYRQITPAQSVNGLTHLYTGRNLDGSTVGIAYQPGLCSPRFGAGLSQGSFNVTLDSLVAAHEIGHNFGAPHDAVEGSPCESEAPIFLMATNLNGNDQFSSCSLTEMQEQIDTAVCITAVPSVDIAAVYNGAAQSVLLGNAATVTFDIPNNGSLNADNVVVEVTLPANVEFVSASASIGSCTSGGGSASCNLGTVTGNSAATVTVSARATAVGSDSFVATVSADADADTGNNEATADLTVEPAVNLTGSASAPAQVTLNQAVTVSATLENLSALDATAIVIGITLDSGLRADSADWPLGSCTVSAQQIDCQASDFANQSSSTLDIRVTGVSVGAQTYSLTLSSAEADSDPGDNSFAGSVTVNALAGSGDSGGGGGAVGPAWLGMLLALVAVRRRYAPAMNVLELCT